jgi:hypothetical protein
MRRIRASEIGEYVFCHRAWWLHHLQGYESGNVRELTEGTSAHVQHGRTVEASRALQVLAVVVPLTAVLVALWPWLFQ